MPPLVLTCSFSRGLTNSVTSAFTLPSLKFWLFCQVLPPSAHTVQPAASKCVLSWLVQPEHQHRKWSAAISLGLISRCLHVGNHKKKFENIVRLVEVGVMLFLMLFLILLSYNFNIVFGSPTFPCLWSKITNILIWYICIRNRLHLWMSFTWILHAFRWCEILGSPWKAPLVEVKGVQLDPHRVFFLTRFRALVWPYIFWWQGSERRAVA